MQFKELSDNYFESYIDNELINREVAHFREKFAIDAPDLVIEQFYIDHGRNETFQNLYGSIDLERIRWSLIEVETEHFKKIDKAASFPDFLEETSMDASHYEEQGDFVFHCTETVIDHWKNHGTWIKPPIFIDGRILSIPTTDFHLVEGHTRVGCVIGCDNFGIIPVAKKHKVYFGEY